MTPEELQKKMENATQNDIDKYEDGLAVLHALKEHFENADSLLSFLAFAASAVHLEFEQLDMEHFITKLRGGLKVAQSFKKTEH